MADHREKNLLQLNVADHYAVLLGIELNHVKSVKPGADMQHLGFMVNLLK